MALDSLDSLDSLGALIKVIITGYEPNSHLLDLSIWS